MSRFVSQVMQHLCHLCSNDPSLFSLAVSNPQALLLLERKARSFSWHP